MAPAHGKYPLAASLPPPSAGRPGLRPFATASGISRRAAPDAAAKVHRSRLARSTLGWLASRAQPTGIAARGERRAGSVDHETRSIPAERTRRPPIGAGHAPLERTAERGMPRGPLPIRSGRALPTAGGNRGGRHVPVGAMPATFPNEPGRVTPASSDRAGDVICTCTGHDRPRRDAPRFLPLPRGTPAPVRSPERVAVSARAAGSSAGATISCAGRRGACRPGQASSFERVRAAAPLRRSCPAPSFRYGRRNGRKISAERAPRPRPG